MINAIRLNTLIVTPGLEGRRDLTAVSGKCANGRWRTDIFHIDSDTGLVREVREGVKVRANMQTSATKRK